MRFLRLTASLLALGLVATSALAQNWPARPIRLIVGYPAGGASDVAARIVGAKLAQRLGQPVIVEKKPGAASNIAADFVAKAPADGYTLLLGTISLSINPSLYSRMPFDPRKDLVAISMISSTPFLLVSNPKSPYVDVHSLLQAARSGERRIDFASAGNGSGAHLFMELFASSAGVKLNHVPYKGAAPAMNDVLANLVPITFDNVITTLPLVRSGRLRALAVSTAQRSKIAPEIPTLAESGVPGFDATAWFGLFAPVATPKEIVQRLGAEVAQAVKDPEVSGKLLKLGAEPVGSDPETFDRFFRGEVAKWAKVVQHANVHID